MVTQKAAGKNFFMRLYDAMMKNIRHVSLIIGLILFFISAACVYMLWMNEQNKSAQKYFGLLVMEYHQAKQDKDFDWEPLLQKFTQGFDKHSRSSLLPCYKDYAVNILLHQNKKEEALALLDTIISDAQASSLLSLYTIERALVALDINDATIKKQGEDTLQALAKDQTDQFHDTALFYLGRYYWTHDNVATARQLWQQLVDEQKDERVAPSPWAQQVKDYLSLVIV